MTTPDPLALAPALVEMSRQRKSWRERLQWVRDRFADPSFSTTPEDLAALAVYLRFLSTGELRCEEDGRHFRPNHLAEAAAQIEAALERLSRPDTTWILRRIFPQLPSWDAEFRRAEPLTRIRDIAHRNDIPQDLKREIKTRLQNKLHRCAGPEDLRTSAEILSRITAPGTNYAGDFVREFRTFHAELSEFFNATALDQRLGTLANGGGAVAEAARAFLALRQDRPPTDERLADLLERLTGLRRAIADQLPGADARRRSQLRLADIGLEDHAFTLLSESANRLGAIGGPELWPRLLRAVAVALENVRWNGLEPEECAALHSEATAWAAVFAPGDDLHLVRILATLARARRLTEAHADRVNALFPPFAALIGNSLGVAEHAVRVFAEGEVRGHLVFPLSRLVEQGLAAARRALRLPPWEAVVTGEALGTLTRLGELHAAEERTGPLILLLNVADGDAEIPSAVRGILLAHPIPHLSHLGVRARQARVPFATAEGGEHFRDFDSLVGKNVRLRVTPDGPHLTEEAAGGATSGPAETPAVVVPDATLTDRAEVVALRATTPATCGAKAVGARRLLELASASGDLFRAPRGLAVPFGVMELTLEKAGLPGEYRGLCDRTGAAQGSELDATLARLNALITGLPAPPEIGAAVAAFFGPETRLAVRSSANGEDLEHLAGAGLYESVVGVLPADVGTAIAKVWASLWTRRAALSRRQAGIAPERIRMAVFVQELVDPELSFIMHTVHPLTGDRAEALVELAVGLGETLASAGQPGVPYRLACRRGDGAARLEACATFSFALRPPDGRSERLDYSRVALSADATCARELGRRLAEVATRVESALGGPQDVEGVLANGVIHLVQARPQQGL